MTVLYCSAKLLKRLRQPVAEGLHGGLEHARDIREVDMRASPYDVSAFFGSDGSRLVAIKIETSEGKREYARLQRGFAARGNELRERVIAAITVARASRPER